ncbi:MULTISPECIES: translation elongation factor Ts [Salegentibacter]|jgi:elongation factor Ts|uniref:Elongation factor Ts n=1 Tax=Salegentibacter mishustinae TaxID=270918 RepID=A0A0Q9ZG14_9FLAO|nr:MULTISPECIES: translation elongation factor Ts [Salegentibacter]KRG27940.1 elongation factor Ts [Salegentibacter mishustinae]MBO2543244.1 elongation factor Ts [Salegentibacter sp. BDJ18]PNW21008.1 elongation factor Ts [Salegentibacter mishustinae]PZX63974.1 elongation factor Ts [Salegentibacter mishustinae]GGW89309.1 elongation factor Ts [Salegentibacter mishustinae]|tara:strand:- start:379 stop:1206 length:828 start_codon:yes stop_codon:yes gene_type:complete
MAKITAAEVNKLRKATGAGMMDCKKALVEADGDFDKAIEVLRKKGQKVAAKRADRDSAEGAAIAKVNDDNTKGIIISLNCETDFVAKNDDFVKMANNFADIALTVSSKEELLKADYNGISVEDKLTEQTGVIGEKIEIGAFKTLEAPFVGSYIHAGNKIAVITGLSKNVEGADEAAKNVSMQAAAMNPIALNEEGVDQETIDKEVEIAKDTLRQEGKPEEMLDKIAKGKIQRYFKDNTLVNQAFIKDGKQSVADYVKSVDSDLTVVGFERVALGE